MAVELLQSKVHLAMQLCSVLNDHDSLVLPCHPLFILTLLRMPWLVDGFLEECVVFTRIIGLSLVCLLSLN